MENETLQKGAIYGKGSDLLRTGPSAFWDGGNSIDVGKRVEMIAKRVGKRA